MKFIDNKNKIKKFVKDNDIENILMGTLFAKSNSSFDGNNTNEYVIGNPNINKNANARDTFRDLEESEPYSYDFLNIFKNIINNNNGILLYYQLLELHDKEKLEHKDGFNRCWKGGFENEEDVIEKLRKAPKKLMHLNQMKHIKREEKGKIRKLTRGEIKIGDLTKNEKADYPYQNFCRKYLSDGLSGNLLVFGFDVSEDISPLSRVNDNAKVEKVFVTYDNDSTLNKIKKELESSVHHNSKFEYVQLSSHGIIWKNY